MSGNVPCNCPERKKPLAQRNWVVSQRNHNRSAFNGYHYTPSAYSTVTCRGCHGFWRTKAAYVNQLPDQR